MGKSLIIRKIVKIMKRVKKKKNNKEEIIILTEKDNKVFFNLILNPPSPNEDLKKEYKKYKNKFL